MKPRRPLKKPKGPKLLVYELIARDSPIGESMYRLLESLIDAYHSDRDLGPVRIALAWNTSWKADVDGRITLGKCKKASDLDRELAPWDFVILLRKDFWQDLRVTDTQRAALLDHELMHAAVKYDEKGAPAVDARGRRIYRTRKHDIEEFGDIIERHGLWKNDLEAFARAIARAKMTSSQWVGYSRLHEALEAAGVTTVNLHVIATWTDDERRAVMTWAVLRQETKKSVDIEKPACLAAALLPMFAAVQPGV